MIPLVKGASGILAFDAQAKPCSAGGRPLHPLRQLHARPARWACCRWKWRLRIRAGELDAATDLPC
jgi:hypothetical protein